MIKAKKGVGQGRAEDLNAADWYALNDADRPLDRMARARWEKWCANLGNRMEYATLIQMEQEVRKLIEPPAPPDREALIIDAAIEPDVLVDSGAISR